MPLAVAAPLAQARRAIAAIAGLSTWVMVIFKPDGSHGMYSWLHFWIATACALTAWYVLYRSPDRRGVQAATPVVNTP
ncbi:transmembrane protein [Mycobacterium tuberculosis]|uniref:Transmembrane protein n=1 Tax=Mycobacterium tuberculosis TaxID=1773 RepID=A0A916LDW3_MYCTX|nr:transmembrane protein [Mycobacterium tuberculosis]